MKVPKPVTNFVMQHPRKLAVAAAIPIFPIGSQILPFWHEIESIMAMMLFLSIIVIVDHKVESGEWSIGD